MTKSGTPAALNELAKEARVPARKAAFVNTDALKGDDVIGDTIVDQPAKVNVSAAQNLAKQVQGRPCQFDADCGLYWLDAGETTTVIGEDQVPRVIERKPVWVDFSKGPVSLNPSNPADAKKIKMLREHISEAKQPALISGLMEVGDGNIPALMDGWAGLKPEMKLKAVKDFSLDVEKAIKWELQNGGSPWLVQHLDALLAPKDHDPSGLPSVDEPEEVDETPDADTGGDEGEMLDREALKAQADELGLKYPKNVTDAKLSAMIDEALEA